MDQSLAAEVEAANTALLANGELEAAGEFFTPDYVAYLTDRELTGGPSGVRRFVQQLRGAFADLRVEVEVLMQAQDRIAWYRTVSGTHRGDFQGFPASGREVVWRDMIVSRFEDGRIAEDWAVSDLAERPLLARKR